jgi:RNA polymerase sigma factor (sigma-70 family)
MASEHAGAMLRHLQRLVETETQRGWSDGQLLQRFAIHREEEAFAALVRRHGRLVWGVCRHILRHEHDAEDAFQATFLVLARRAAAIRKFESIGSWLHGVAYRIAVRAKQTAAKRQRREQLAAVPEGTGATPDLAWRELQALLDEEVARLPEKYRAPFVLCCLEGRSRTEATAELGLPKGTVSSRIAHARRLLQERLARRGVTLSAALTAGTLWGSTAGAAVPVALARTTLAVATGQASGGISPAVAALADGALCVFSAGRVVVSLALLLTATVIGVLGHWPSAANADPDPQAESANIIPSLPPSERLDRHGDPLPADAVTRLGTSRFWCGANGRTQVAFSSDGGKMLAAHWGGVFVYDATTGKQLRYINVAALKRSVNSMSLSPDGKYLALGTDSNADSPRGLQIWDLASGKLLRECHDTGRQQYLNVLFAPDGKTLASYSFPAKAIHLWDPATARAIRRWPLASEHGGSFAFSPDSKTLIAGDGRTIHFWDIATGRERRRIVDHPGDFVGRLTLMHDGKVLASQALKETAEVAREDNRDSKVLLWDAATGKKLRQIEVIGDPSTKHARRLGNPSLICYFQFSPDAATLMTASFDGVLRLWDVTTGKELRRWDTSGWINAFAFAPDGKTLASIGSGNTVRLWDVATGKELCEHSSHRNGFHALAVSPDGRTVASAGWDEDVRLWDAATGRLRHRLTARDGSLHAPRFSADGRTLTALGDDGKARIWDVATGEERRQFPVAAAGLYEQHALSPDGTTWASVLPGSQNRTTDIVLWDATTGRKRQVLAGNVWWIGALAFAPDNRALYSWSGEKKVRSWDTTTGKGLREFAAGAPYIYTGRFSPDGNWFACGGRERVLLLYDMATGTEVRRITIPGMREDRPSFAFSPNGRLLALGDEEGTIHLVELASGKFRRRLTGGHQGGISALLFSTDGKRLVSGSTDTTALVWDLTRRNGKRQPLGAADLDACWAALASADAERADQAIGRLAASPTEMLPYLEKRLQPAVRADARRVARLIADLDSDQFVVRKQAADELEKLGEAATAMYRTALAGNPSLELRRRLEALLEKQDQERRMPSLERLRILRALEALELAGTPKARQLLQKLTGGAPEACLTREAKAALERLARQP